MNLRQVSVLVIIMSLVLGLTPARAERDMDIAATLTRTGLGYSVPLSIDGLGEGPLNPVLNWVYEGDTVGDELGSAVGTAGDVNGDGYADVIIGARHDNVNTMILKEGAAYVFYGGPAGVNDAPSWAVGSQTKGALFGAAVGTAGDVNGDGYADVIVGAPNYRPSQEQVGAVFVYYGSMYGLSHTPDWSIIGTQKDSELGASVGSAGDVNNDGYADVIIGAPKYDTGVTSAGQVWVFYGSSSGITTTVPGWQIEGDQYRALLGSSVGTAGDVNGDGYDDVIVGAPGYTLGQSDEGGAFVFLGSSTGISTTVPVWIGEGNQADAGFGNSVGTAGDVNGDGWDDVIVGAPGYDSQTNDVGAVFVYYGSPSGPGDWTRAMGNQQGAYFAEAVGAAGDVNGDGFADVIVGAPFYTNDQNAEGAVFIYLGTARGLNPFQAWHAEGNKAETQFGAAVGTAGYVNDGSMADLVVGAPKFRQETDVRGRAYVYLGGEIPFPMGYTYLPLVVR